MIRPADRNHTLEKLREVARRVGDGFDGLPSVAAVLVHGSVALGVVDELSDVDLLVVFRSEIPPLSERVRILRVLGSGWSFDERTAGSLFPVVDKDGEVGGVPVTVHYQTVPWIDGVLSEVLDRGAISTEALPFRPYTLPALIQRAWVLRDHNGHVERWREWAEVYPERLRANILRHFAPTLMEHTDELERTARRGLGARNFIFFLNWAVDDLTSILFALNGVYDPADRRMDTCVVPHLPYLPAGYVAAMQDVLEGPFDDRGMRCRAQLFQGLVTEVLERVEAFS